MKDRKKNTIIRIKGLTKRYDTVLAVDNLSLNIREGEIFGLLGPNGAGKTTTTLMLLGLTEPSSGQAFIDGNDCTRNPIEVKKTVGYLPDSVGFYPDLTGRENLIFTGMLNGLDREESGQRAERLLERVGMSYAADRKAGSYSRGMKQRLGIADVLMKDPKVIIMDEPTLGIDPEGMRELIALIRELSVEDGRTILISSHQLYQVQQICDRVGIFVQGRLIACGQIEELGHQLESEGHYELELSAFPADEGLRAVIEGIRGVGGLQEKEEVEIARALKLLLEKNRFTVDMVHSGTDAWDYLIHMEYDAVVLDIMMPGMDGMEVLRRARERRINTPVLFLTAKSEVEDRVSGLMAGADDYLPKPFASSEFIARVKALARRSGAYQPQLITVGQTVLDCGRYELAGETDVLRLNKKEYQLMELFMKHPGQVFSTEHLMKQVWELDTEAGPDVVWTYMGFLRRKLKQAGADVEIRTVRGAGYALEERKC